MLGKKSSEKSAKNVFLYSHDNRDQKMGGKNGRNNFSRKKRIVRAKNVGKKIVGKKCEKRFFIFTRISLTKNWEKKCAKYFFQKDTNSASKKCWEKYHRKKVRKKFFYIHTNIVNKKWGGNKRAKQLFHKHTNSARKKCSEKNRRKKVRKTFFIFTQNRDQIMGGKTRETIFPETHE